MDVSVIGCGRWGAFLAWYAANAGHRTLLYGRAESARMRELAETRTNTLLALPEGVALTCDLAEAAQNEVILVSVPSQGFRALARDMRFAKDKLFVLCMKGLEIETGLRLTEVARHELDPSCRVAVWLGPGHVQEFLRGVPNCMVIDAERDEDKELLVNELSGELIRFYYGNDLIGNEVGAAAKNVVGIAAGLLDGFGLSSLKGALMSRGTREFARLIVAMGGNELSAYGLCHLGDYEATVFSRHSHNRMCGECLAKGEPYTELAEGYYTVKALMGLAGKIGVELPISAAVYDVLYREIAAKEALDCLFSRSLKEEFQ